MLSFTVVPLIVWLNSLVFIFEPIKTFFESLYLSFFCWSARSSVVALPRLPFELPPWYVNFTWSFEVRKGRSRVCALLDGAWICIRLTSRTRRSPIVRSDCGSWFVIASLIDQWAVGGEKNSRVHFRTKEIGWGRIITTTRRFFLFFSAPPCLTLVWWWAAALFFLPNSFSSFIFHGPCFGCLVEWTSRSFFFV